MYPQQKSPFLILLVEKAIQERVNIPKVVVNLSICHAVPLGGHVLFNSQDASIYFSEMHFLLSFLKTFLLNFTDVLEAVKQSLWHKGFML